MEPTALVIGGGVAVVLAIVVLILLLGRRQRRRAFEPVRLGPAWTPPVGDDEGEWPPPVPDPEARAQAVQERTGLDRRHIDMVLNAWDEYLAVIGVTQLPPTHHYRVYDPYDPPVAERGPEGPVPDPVRVARDVSYRTDVPEVDATTILEALFEHEAGGRDGW